MMNDLWEREEPGLERSTCCTAGMGVGWTRALQTALDALLAGRSVVVEGPPASGISRLLRQVVAELEPARVVCDPSDGRLDALDRAVLVVDDADRLDEPTADRLAGLVLAGRVAALLGTKRPSAMVSRLRSTGDVRSLELGPLDGEEIAALVCELVGAPPDGATVRTPPPPSRPATRKGCSTRAVRTGHLAPVHRLILRRVGVPPSAPGPTPVRTAAHRRGRG